MQHFLFLCWQLASKPVSKCIAESQPPHKIFLIPLIMRSDSTAKLLLGTSHNFFPEIPFSLWRCLYSPSWSQCGSSYLVLPKQEITAQPKGLLHTMFHCISSKWYTLYLTHNKPCSHKAVTKKKWESRTGGRAFYSFYSSTKSSGTDSSLKVIFSLCKNQGKKPKSLIQVHYHHNHPHPTHWGISHPESATTLKISIPGSILKD